MGSSIALNTLPPEILAYTFSYLDDQALARTSRVCHLFEEIVGTIFDSLNSQLEKDPSLKSYLTQFEGQNKVKTVHQNLTSRIKYHKNTHSIWQQANPSKSLDIAYFRKLFAAKKLADELRAFKAIAEEKFIARQYLESISTETDLAQKVTMLHTWFDLNILNLNTFTIIDLSNAQLGTLPVRITRLTLQTLNLSNNCLTELPEEIGQLASVKKIDLSCNRLVKLPISFAQLSQLEELSLNDNQITILSPSFFSLTSLSKLNLEGNNLQEISDKIQQLVGLSTLLIGSNPLKHLPIELNYLTNLETLTLSQNPFDSMDIRPGLLLNLQVIDISETNTKEFPAGLCTLHHLKSIHATNNQIETLPNEIENLQELTELFLNQNRLKALPSKIGKLNNLEVLRVDQNLLDDLPVELMNAIHITTFIFSQNPFKNLNKYMSDYLDKNFKN